MTEEDRRIWVRFGGWAAVRYYAFSDALDYDAIRRRIERRESCGFVFPIWRFL